MGLKRENMLVNPGVIVFLEEELFELSTKEQKGMSKKQKELKRHPGKNSSLPKRLGVSSKVTHLGNTGIIGYEAEMYAISRGLKIFGVQRK